METKSPKPKAAAPPGSRSWISTAKDPAYWQALGEFIEAFASAELLLFNYLVMHAAIPHSTARVLLPEIRADRIVDCIRAVWNVRTPDVHIRQELDVALAQVKEINKRRNSMVHNVSLVTSDKGRISSNITRAFTHKCPKEYRVAPDIIRDMIADLEKISAHVVYALIIIAEPRTSRDDLMRDLPALRASWQYGSPHALPVSAPKRKRRDRGRVSNSHEEVT